jgi:hypothetical protein
MTTTVVRALLSPRPQVHTCHGFNADGGLCGVSVRFPWRFCRRCREKLNAKMSKISEYSWWLANHQNSEITQDNED